MILEHDTDGKFFRLDNLVISQNLKNRVIDISKKYKTDFRYYGKLRRRLYMYRLDIDSCPEINEIYQKFVNPNVVDSVEIMLCEPGCVLVPHTDTDRYAAINIPISGNFDKSFLSFFKPNSSGKVNTTHQKNTGSAAHSPGTFYENPQQDGTVYYQYPICINVETVHNASNAGNDNRILLSVGTSTVKFSELEKLHRENNLLV